MPQGCSACRCGLSPCSLVDGRLLAPQELPVTQGWAGIFAHIVAISTPLALLHKLPDCLLLLLASIEGIKDLRHGPWVVDTAFRSEGRYEVEGI